MSDIKLFAVTELVHVLAVSRVIESEYYMLCIVYEVCQICERRLSCSLVIAGISGHSVPIDHNADAEGNFSVLALKRDPDARHTHGWRFTTVGIVEKKKPDDVSFQLPISICHAYVN